MREVTVDGHRGKQVTVTMPNYEADECIEQRFGILQDAHLVGGNAPSLWAQTPGQVNKMWVLDVDGTRLQILYGYPPDVSEQDKADLEAMVETIEIG